MHRIQQLSAQLSNDVSSLERNGTASKATPQAAVWGSVGSKSDDDVVVVASLRTAITKAGKGKFKVKLISVYFPL